jgi:hypothetical protein
MHHAASAGGGGLFPRRLLKETASFLHGLMNKND